MYHGERFNSISHLVGAGLAAGGSAVLIVPAGMAGDPWKIVSFSIYGAMLVLLYVFSTLYHSISGRAKNVLRKFDHCSIYLLIAGSYTPFALVSLRGAWGWSLLGVVWSLAVLGIVQEIWLARGARVVSLVIYVVMGWLALVAVLPLWAALTPAGFAWLAAGGACYTLGIGFYTTDHKLRHGHGHGWWHLCVLGGSICHFITVLLYVA
ncbi:MAG TPA: hemolysin III family protein [Polaromonas sp.]|uniref:PAQR family membrane homeostasis protein TrhA n=1 Tax=Polaromonas sp. TaxID=1869339 RepID=UPI002D46E2E4|nr:hemolysin III family protein [Polaromonas sp.]HYW58169.1 hemolysin III family protein [Polaromonas sp.]